MAFEIPYDLIRKVQISLRNEANLSSYDPDDPSLPSLPSLQQTLSQLDPSPPYLRCKHCEARLLRGIQSLICVFCGRYQCRDPPPEPLNFRDTFGCRWLLESLDLQGTEMVVPSVGANESNRGQSAQKDEFPLSDLLNLEIKLSVESEKVWTAASSETSIQNKRSLNLAGVDLDNFFADGERHAASSASEEQLAWNKQIGRTESNEFQVRENLSLFENVQPPETSTWSTEDVGGDSVSGWEANFQSADSGTTHEETKSLDPFVGSAGDISAHLDSVFGPGKDSIDGKAKDNTVSSASLDSGWFQDDLWSNSNAIVTARTEQAEMTANTKDSRLEENVNDSSSASVDWLQADKWHTNSEKAPDNKIIDEDDDSFDSWNDFASSTSAPNPSTSSWDQIVNYAAPSLEQTSEQNLSVSANNSQELDFGGFLQPGLFSGASSNPNGAPEVNTSQSEASSSDRMAETSSKAGGDDEDVTKGDDVSSAKTWSNSSDVESIMSQMKDLSFMLESNLSIPLKRDGSNSFSNGK
ncbi:uncharacterized protein LOC122303788 [Carya illinoinensis]|uniref:DUF7815 domain-containing protein n=1 Tax=Carya illinoinensis TaxID=32201 RepID=A0A922FL12_CARIL|nr:uncharacterized protein LOC122303788 [Carya illinoinensis]KAG6722238.1 hypothetical protein I3842_03G150800 [Carya illinoinensis]